MIKLTNRRFFFLLLLAHAALLYIVVYGTFIQALSTFLVFVFITLFSSTVVYHRLLSHRSWNAPRWYEVFGTIIGIFSFTGTPITRTLAHRYHHAYSDTKKDPHSPRAHGIFLAYFPMLKNEKLNPVLVRDLLNDPLHRFIHEKYLDIIVLSFVITALALGLTWALALLVAPGALCWANISLCNIACHWGKDGDPLSQNQLLALLTFGEGFHQHHHDHAEDPDFSNGRGFDPGYAIIKLLSKR